MRKPFIKQKEVIIPFCEGEAEINLFSFLKIKYSNKKIEFRKPVNLGGFSDLTTFKRKYNKCCSGQNVKPKKDFSNVRFLFIFDDDLADSAKIKNFLGSEGHLLQQCNPNVEGMLLGMVGKNQGTNLKTESFRKKCKQNFQKYFSCEAHRLKEKKLHEIFIDECFISNELPILHSLFNA